MRITSEQQQRLEEIGRMQELRFSILHGSYAREMADRASDLDIAVVAKRPLPFEKRLDLHAELAEVFGDSAERELDLKTLHAVDSLFRYEVVRDGMLLYGDPHAYEEYRAYAYRDYVDSQNLRELEGVLLKKSIRSLAERYAE